MKKILYFFVLSVVSCNQKAADKPDNLIAEDKMAEILYELSVINASRSFRTSNANEVMDINATFFDFHGIDSLQFAVSNAYYASQPKQYLKIVERAEDLLEAQKDSLVGIKKNQQIDTAKVKMRRLKK